MKYHEEDPSQFQAAKARRLDDIRQEDRSKRMPSRKQDRWLQTTPDIDTKAHESSLGTLNRNNLFHYWRLDMVMILRSIDRLKRFVTQVCPFLYISIF